MLKLNETIKPHLGEKVLFAGSELSGSKYAMILLHGRGGNAESMLSLANEFDLEDTLVIAPQADNFTWYPYRFIEKREVNEPGISSGLVLINSIMNSLGQSRIKSENVFILGFSQGACLALDYTVRFPKKYAGVFVLSGGLIGDEIVDNDYKGDLQDTPVFLGCSDVDFHIPEKRVYKSAEIAKLLNAEVKTKIYPNMEHTINHDEINMINQILSNHYKLSVI